MKTAAPPRLQNTNPRILHTRTTENTKVFDVQLQTIIQNFNPNALKTTHSHTLSKY